MLTDLSKIRVLPLGFLNQVREFNIEDLSSHYPGPWDTKFLAALCSYRWGSGVEFTFCVSLASICMHVNYCRLTCHGANTLTTSNYFATTACSK